MAEEVPPAPAYYNISHVLFQLKICLTTSVEVEVTEAEVATAVAVVVVTPRIVSFARDQNSENLPVAVAPDPAPAAPLNVLALFSFPDHQTY
jgi:hypothetical protein